MGRIRKDASKTNRENTQVLPYRSFPAKEGNPPSSPAIPLSSVGIDPPPHPSRRAAQPANPWRVHARIFLDISGRQTKSEPRGSIPTGKGLLNNPLKGKMPAAHSPPWRVIPPSSRTSPANRDDTHPSPIAPRRAACESMEGSRPHFPGYIRATNQKRAARLNSDWEGRDCSNREGVVE